MSDPTVVAAAGAESVFLPAISPRNQTPRSLDAPGKVLHSKSQLNSPIARSPRLSPRANSTVAATATTENITRKVSVAKIPQVPDHLPPLNNSHHHQVDNSGGENNSSSSSSAPHHHSHANEILEVADKADTHDKQGDKHSKDSPESQELEEPIDIEPSSNNDNNDSNNNNPESLQGEIFTNTDIWAKANVLGNFTECSEQFLTMCNLTAANYSHASILSLAKSTTPEKMQELGFRLDALASGSPDALAWTTEVNTSSLNTPLLDIDCPYEIHVTRKVGDAGRSYLYVVLRQVRSPSRSSFIRQESRARMGGDGGVDVVLSGDRRGGGGGVSANSLRILLVDDSMTVLKMVSRIIENEGHKVDCKTDGAAALEALKNNHYDAVLMDIHMPHMGGLEASHEFRIHEGLMRQYKGEGSHPHQKLIAMSADFSGTLIHEIMTAGFDGFLAKPITKTAFRELKLKPVQWKAASGIQL